MSVNKPVTVDAVALPPVIGHRGAALHAPENTLASFRLAKRLGCSCIEFDVRLTADGGLVVCHDSRLDRTTMGSGVIAALPLATVRACDAGVRKSPAFAGERVPTLREVLDLAVDLSLSVDIEIKADRGRDYATAAAVADVINNMPEPPRGLVSSFQQPALTAIRALAPQMPRGILFGLIPPHWAQVAARLGCCVIGADHRRLTRRRVAAIRAAGYPLAAFTVNDAARARVLYNWGVTSVFSDAPDMIIKAGMGPAPASPTTAPKLPAVVRQGRYGEAA
ncbi:MAG: glycerophosphoryl diester phosphodiesterase [Alphaproteobacteria bacterium]|nr:glycerophosphoryl diester phosphodiesterase [Alphaproteobacteria bacterium]